MQKHLKKKLEALWDKLGDLQEVLSEVQTSHTEYDEARSEKWHESEAGSQSEMDSGELEDAINSLEEVVACIDRLIH